MARGRTIKTKELGDLQDLFLKHCPPNEYGERSIPLFAAFIGASVSVVYKWIAKKSVSPAWAKTIEKKTNGKIKRSQLNDLFK